MKNNIFFLALLLAVVSCTKEQGVSGPAGSQGPAGANGKAAASDTQSIKGTVIVYNEFSTIQSDASGVVVTLGSGSQTHKDTTDAAGNYDFPGITTGTYDLTFQRSGFGTMKYFGLSHFGGGTLPTQVPVIDLLQIPVKTAPDTLLLTSNSYGQAVFTLRLDTSSLQYTQLNSNMLVFIAKNRVGNPNDYDVAITSNSFPDGAGGYTVNYYKYGIQSNPAAAITIGDTLYAVAYTYNRNNGTASGSSQSWGDLGSGSYYVDPQTGKIVNPNLSKPSNIVKFVF
jgi:hypothetical protein